MKQLMTGMLKVSKEAKIRNQYNQVPHLIHDTTQESDKPQYNITHKKAKSQPFPSRWPQGCTEQTRKHDKHVKKWTKMIRFGISKIQVKFLIN